MFYALLHHFLIRKPNEEKERLGKTVEAPTCKEELDYESRPGVATEILQAKKVSHKEVKQKEREEIGPYLKSMELNGRVVCMIHAILPR